MGDVQSKDAQTHLANATNKRLRVKMSYEATNINLQFGRHDFQGDISSKKSDQGELLIGPGSCVLIHKEVRTANRAFMLGGDLYVTIQTEDGQKICGNFKVPSDRSIIVTKQKSVVLARYGNLWVDQSGKNHK